MPDETATEPGVFPVCWATMKKADLPVKPCLRCGRPFTWRKKWARVWAEVKYCSERCRRTRSTTPAG